MKDECTLSLDISSTSTGWCFMCNTDIVAYGTISIDRTKYALCERLVRFRKELVSILNKYQPNHVVIENGFFNKNVKTLKVLSNFFGVAVECTYSELGIKPYIMVNTTPKSHFGVRNKKDLFDKMINLYSLDRSWVYEEHNDITDAIAQARCYYDTEINVIWRE